MTDPGGLPGGLDSPFWRALPSWGELGPVDGCARLTSSTELRMAHDARHLAILVRCEESDMGGLWTRRKAATGRLDLDEGIEVLLDPSHSHESWWSVRVTPAGEWESILPAGASAGPECRIDVRRESGAWLVLLRVPFADLGLEGELRGTPIDGETWGFGLLRRRRETAAGLREVAAWGIGTLEPAGAQVRQSARPDDPRRPRPAGHLRFQGGRTVRPVELARYVPAGFGVNEICVSFEKGSIPEGAAAELRPSPAARLRSKDVSRLKFRVARPGLYRYTVTLPYLPPGEPSEEELARLEAEAGRELSEDELANILAKRSGTPEYVAGLSFELTDLWSEVEAMEQEVARLEAELAECDGLGEFAQFGRAASEFRAALDKVDAFRSPHAKGRLADELVQELRNRFADAREASRGELLRRGKISIASPYLASGNWYLGALRVRTDHSDGSAPAAELAKKLRAAGLQFVAFADLAEGGDQDGDGLHDWNGDGVVASAPRRLEQSRRAVREDRGREAYVRDYSRTAAEQGYSWVSEDWKLSSSGEFVVLRAVETGSHFPALCIGLKAGPLPPGSWETYDAIELAQSAGGIAALCDGDSRLRELPSELSNVLGIDAPAEVWDRLLAARRRTLLVPGTRLDAKDLADGKLPDRAFLAGVLASELTEEAIVAALRRGSFYVTTVTGPRITGIEAKGDTLTVRTQEPCQMLFRGEGGQVLGGAFGTEASYRFTGRERFVRAVCLADVLDDGFRLEAMTQAFYLSDDLPRSPLGESDSVWTVAGPSAAGA